MIKLAIKSIIDLNDINILEIQYCVSTLIRLHLHIKIGETEVYIIV